MNNKLLRKIIVGVLLVFTISLGFISPIHEWISIPNEIVLIEGEELNINKPSLFTHNLDRTSQEDLIVFNMLENKNEEPSIQGSASMQGEDTVTLGAGNIPLKNIDVKVLPKITVIPGGQSIGVKLNTDGVLVVGHHLVQTENGEQSPGELAGIKVGDMITKINGNKVEKMNQVASIVQEAGEKGEVLKIEVKRDGSTYTKELTPLKSKGEPSYRLGLYIRDSAAGVGTLTFYEPNSKKYGALGHVISDVDTQKPIVVHDGHIIRSSVTSIEKGSNGDPGEKLASFSNQRQILGTIEKNSSFGIFGELTSNHSLKNNVIDKELPIALADQVKEGPAKILTVVEGEEVKEFDIEIISSTPQKYPATKGMVINITDKELLEATGGIVQGMSGSPIIQDGKVIGAVTHVFVNDPTSGYGCHIEWMLEEAGIDIKGKVVEKAS